MLRILLGKSENTRESANCFIRFKIVIQDLSVNIIILHL